MNANVWLGVGCLLVAIIMGLLVIYHDDPAWAFLGLFYNALGCGFLDLAFDEMDARR